MGRLNCWEFKKCGRQPDGLNVAQLGICSACLASKLNGVNGGRNGGRSCWAVAGTLCGGKVQGTFAMKLADCLKCEFYRIVSAEEGAAYASSKDILDKLQ